jgi:hypothetical protein
MRIDPVKGLLGISAMKKIIHREYPFPKNLKAHITCKSKKSNNFWQVKDSRKIPKLTYSKSRSRNLSRCDVAQVFPGHLERPLANHLCFRIIVMRICMCITMFSVATPDAFNRAGRVRVSLAAATEKLLRTVTVRERER